MTFTLQIELGNAAMQTAEQIAYALETVSQSLEKRYGGLITLPKTDVPGLIRDVNGNKVGYWTIAA